MTQPAQNLQPLETAEPVKDRAKQFLDHLKGKLDRGDFKLPPVLATVAKVAPSLSMFLPGLTTSLATWASDPLTAAKNQLDTLPEEKVREGVTKAGEIIKWLLNEEIR